MITCAINGCPSTQYMKINGERISFFPFPEDDIIKSRWLENCNLASGIVSNTKTPYLCELHFEKNDFTPSKDLKAKAVPILFGHIEEPSRKCLAKNITETTLKKMPLKDKSSEYLTSSERQSPLQDDIAEQSDKNKMDLSIDDEKNTNNCNPSPVHEKLKKNAKMYRLTIRIDKIRKNMSGLKNKSVCIADAKLQGPIEKRRKEVGKDACKSCKLRKCVYNMKPAFQCEVCEQYYLLQNEEGAYTCPVCAENFIDPQRLSAHIRKHFVCAICRIECDSEKAYDKHVGLHVSSDPLNPYKCHQCYKTFARKENVTQHCLNEHSKGKLQIGMSQKTSLQITSPSVTTITAQKRSNYCMTCNLEYKTEEFYNEHLKSHKKTEESAKYNISETNNVISVPNPLTGNQIGILQAIKFSCRVCQQEFDNVCEVDAHTKTHLYEKKTAQDGLKCNICKKVFTDNAVFSEHLKQHLSRAYPCPICSKAFINRTTLKAHLETHSKS